MSFAFVSGVAICGVCQQRHVLPALKAAQTLRHHAFAQHVTAHQGLAFYTPHVNGPPSVAELSETLNIGHVFAAMPVTPHGEHIRLEDYAPIPQNDLAPAAVRDIEDERNDLSSEKRTKRPDHLDDLQEELQAMTS
jgi:hypothetical protein